MRRRPGRATMQEVALAITLTLWISFGAYLFFPTVNAPAEYSRVAIGVCGSELVAALIWSVGREDCADRACSPWTEMAGSVAGVQLPALTAALVVVAAAYGLLTARS